MVLVRPSKVLLLLSVFLIIDMWMGMNCFIDPSFVEPSHQ